MKKSEYLRRDYFSDYIILLLNMNRGWTPRTYSSCIMPKVVEFIRSKINKGVYEPSQVPIDQDGFGELKKDGDYDPIDLHTLNSVTIRDAGLPPIIDNFINPFWTLSILWIRLTLSYDARILHQESWPHAFQTPLGLLWYTSYLKGSQILLRVSELHHVHPTGRNTSSCWSYDWRHWY